MHLHANAFRSLNPRTHASIPHSLPLLLPADPALGCLTGHTDYVTGLAASQSGSMLASGGLRGEVLLWDLAGLRQVMSGTVPVSFDECPAHLVISGVAFSRVSWCQHPVA